MADSFATRALLDVNGTSYTYASLAKLGERFDLAKLPYAMKILLENLLRHEDGGITVGRVENYEIEPDNINRVKVLLRVARETPVRENTKASVSRNVKAYA